jgi:hypothetical protein
MNFNSTFPLHTDLRALMNLTYHGEYVNFKLNRNKSILTAEAQESAVVTDPYARMCDPASPQKAAEYSQGLTEKDRETTIKL